MDKRKIFAVINDSATESEQAEVLEWIGRSPDNHRYYILLKNLYAAGAGGSDRRAEPSGFEELGNIHARKYGRKKLFAGRRIWIFAVASVVAAFAVVSGMLMITRHTMTIGQNDSVISYMTPRGVKGEVVLPDGSVVTLNADSRISFPARFKGGFRDVEFCGEGYFKVVGNPDFPMRIRLDGDVALEVKGTEFNLSCYPDDNTVRASLYSGILSVSYKNPAGRRHYRLIEPNETLIIRTDREQGIGSDDPEAPLDETILLPPAESAWQRGEIIFDDEPMTEIIKKLRRWHGVEFVVKDETILNRTLTARFKSESIPQIMYVIRIAAGIDYSIEGNVVTLFAIPKAR